MAQNFIEPRGLRHTVETIDGVERLRIPIRRQWFMVLFLPLWLVGWGFGWFSAAMQISQHFDTFLAVWLCAWTVGGIFAGGILFGQLFGAELVSVVGRDLQVQVGVGPLKRIWRYRGDRIEHLIGWTAVEDMFGMRSMQRPFWLRPKSGAVKFDYGADSVFLAPGVDEPEGRVIAAWLAKRLPRSASAMPE
ncbi:hypothetical protein ACVWYO_000725 [Sphingomonas sp. UYP23]